MSERDSVQRCIIYLDELGEKTQEDTADTHSGHSGKVEK